MVTQNSVHELHLDVHYPINIDVQKKMEGSPKGRGMECRKRDVMSEERIGRQG